MGPASSRSGIGNGAACNRPNLRLIERRNHAALAIEDAQRPRGHMGREVAQGKAVRDFRLPLAQIGPVHRRETIEQRIDRVTAAPLVVSGYFAARLDNAKP